MKEIKDRLYAIRGEIGERAFEDDIKRTERLEEAMRSLIDIMIEACDEHEG